MSEIKDKIERFYENLSVTLADIKFFDEQDGIDIPNLFDKKTRFDQCMKKRKKHIQKIMCVESDCKKHGFSDKRIKE